MTAEEGKQKNSPPLEGGELITRHHRMGFPQEMGTQHDKMIAVLHFDTPSCLEKQLSA